MTFSSKTVNDPFLGDFNGYASAVISRKGAFFWKLGPLVGEQVVHFTSPYFFPVFGVATNNDNKVPDGACCEAEGSRGDKICSFDDFSRVDQDL